MSDLLKSVLIDYSLVAGFALIGLTVAFSYLISGRLTRGRLHGSAVALFIGLLLAYWGGLESKTGKAGIADIPIFAGVGVMGGAMLRDFAIVATAMGVRLEELRKTGLGGVISLVLGVIIPFVIGAIVARAFGYKDAVSMTTIGGGAATFIVGPITGAALGASSEVMALSVATGLVKAILVMIFTPFGAKFIGLDNPRTALIFGGLMGTTSGVAGGLAATDPKLVPYGAMTATFHTGLGCLMGPTVMYAIIRMFA
jgi:malonate transporter MadM subunit